ncbi:MAG: hypothetical protein U0136_06775 [Bdellovibrionota bacterium]
MNHLYVSVNPGDTTKTWTQTVGQTQRTAFLADDFTGDGAGDVACIDIDSDDDPHVILTHGPGRISSTTVPWTNKLRSGDQLTFYFVAGDFNGDLMSDVMSFYVQRAGNNTDVYSKVTFGPAGATATSDPQDWYFPNERNSAFVSGKFRGPGSSNDLTSDVAAISDNGSGGFRARFFIGPNGTYVGGADWTLAGIAASKPVAFRAADFNGDGFADLAAVFYTAASGRYTAHLSFGPTGASTQTWDLGNQPLTAIIADDFNGDGYGDLAGIKENGNQRTAVIALGSASGITTQTANWTLTNSNEAAGTYLAGKFSLSRISGRVTHVDGTPFDNVQIDADVIGATSTAADGTYEIDGFVDGMQFTLVPSTSALGPIGLGYHFNPVVGTGLIQSDTVVNFVGEENRDTDGDGIFDHIDTDDDNDGLSDLLELEHGTDPLNPDTDGDGVTDGQEIIDGSDPLDRGSNNRPLNVELCSEWNGFLDMWNVQEHVNRSTTTLDIVTTLYNQAGEPQSTQSFSLPPGRHYDLLVHEMRGWEQNSYGKVCSRAMNGAPGDLDGRMVYYKPDAPFSNPQNERFEFAFALKFANGLRGRQYVGYNTYQPSLDPAEADFLAANWIQLNNLENTTQTGTLIFYGQDGEIRSSRTMSLGSNARIDVGAHDIGRSLVGLVAWVPDNPRAEFLLRNARYFYANKNASENHFLTAFDFDGATGNGREVVVPLDTQQSSAIVEISNTLNTEVFTQVKIYTAAGELRDLEEFVLAPHATRHIISDPFLRGEKGIATVQGSEPESLLTTSMQYGRTPQKGITYLYGVSATEALGMQMEGSYNTYLKQGCSLTLMNQGNTAVSAAVSLTDGDSTANVLSGFPLQVPARGLLDFNLCARVPADTFGTLTVQSGAANALSAVVIRKGNQDDYRFPTPLH